MSRVGPYPDATFGRWAEEGLVWLPDRGMGYFPVGARDEDVYDAAYFQKYRGYAETTLGRRLTAARIALVGRHWNGRVLDVGIGSGQFVEAHGRALGYDVSAPAIAWLLERRLFHDPYAVDGGVDAVCCWDSLEHVREPARLIASARRWLFLAVPIVPGTGPPLPDWRHFRPEEHRWYWTTVGLILWLAEQGFEVVEAGMPETDLGRSDIWSFACRRWG
jgi:hypothetical protein